ncbi:MAG: hypothetical protein ABI899_02385 [Actinomycetota bacterium]
MSVLPVSVRLALWATAAYAGRLPIEEVVAKAHPDIDHVAGELDHLSLWHDLGERAVLVALPRPGKLSGMPRGSAELIAAATDAGECIFVPGVGGALVPTIETFGSSGDQGTRVTWTAYDAEPVQTHVLEALSLGEIALDLRQAVRDTTAMIDALDAKPWSSRLRSLADDLPGKGWGLPDGLPPRAHRIMATASQVGAAAELGLSIHAESQVLTSQLTGQRRLLLTHLDAIADLAMAGAATVAALSLAGLRPDHGDR